MNQQNNQSIITESTIEDIFDDLTVQDAEAIKGGPNDLINEFLADDKYVTSCVDLRRR